MTLPRTTNRTYRWCTRAQQQGRLWQHQPWGARPVTWQTLSRQWLIVDDPLPYPTGTSRCLTSRWTGVWFSKVKMSAGQTEAYTSRDQVSVLIYLKTSCPDWGPDQPWCCHLSPPGDRAALLSKEWPHFGDKTIQWKAPALRLQDVGPVRVNGQPSPSRPAWALLGQMITRMCYLHHLEYETGGFAFLNSNIKSPLLLDLLLPFYKKILLFWLLLVPLHWCHVFPQRACASSFIIIGKLECYTNRLDNTFCAASVLKISFPSRNVKNH